MRLAAWLHVVCAILCFLGIFESVVKEFCVARLHDKGNLVSNALLTGFGLRLILLFLFLLYFLFASFSLEACKLFAEESNRVQYLDSDHSVEALHAFGIRGIDAHYSQYDRRPATITEAHALGMTVNTWTVNTLEDARRLHGLGVDMVTTDEPELLKGL